MYREIGGGADVPCLEVIPHSAKDALALFDVLRVVKFQTVAEEEVFEVVETGVLGGGVRAPFLGFDRDGRRHGGCLLW